MHPTEAVAKLDTYLRDRIIQDIISPHRDDVLRLAGCCGRRVTGVQLLPATPRRPGGRVIVALEPAAFHDEPPAFLLPIAPVQDIVRRSRQVYLHLTDQHRITLTLVPANGRDPYTASAEITPQVAAFFRWALTENGGRLSVKVVRGNLPCTERRAQALIGAWEDAGLIHKPRTRRPHHLTQRAIDALQRLAS